METKFKIGDLVEIIFINEISKGIIIKKGFHGSFLMYKIYPISKELKKWHTKHDKGWWWSEIYLMKMS